MATASCTWSIVTYSFEVIEMICNITDRDGEPITIGSVVEVYEDWLKVPTTKVGVVREIVLRAGCDPFVKVSGVLNRNLGADSVKVLKLTKGEQSLVNAFVDAGVTPNIQTVRDVIEDVRSECVEDIIVNGDLDVPA